MERMLVANKRVVTDSSGDWARNNTQIIRNYNELITHNWDTSTHTYEGVLDDN